MINGKTLKKKGGDTLHDTNDAICKRISCIQTKHWFPKWVFLLVFPWTKRVAHSLLLKPNNITVKNTATAK